MSRPNVRESRASPTKHHEDAHRDRYRWLPPVVALLLLLIVVLSLQAPTGGAGDKANGGQGQGITRSGDGQGDATRELGGSTKGDARDAGGRDNGHQGDPLLAGSTDDEAAIASAQGETGSSQNENEPDASPNAIGHNNTSAAAATLAAQPQKGAASDIDAAPLPALGFASDLAAAPEPKTEPPTNTPSNAARTGVVSTGNSGTPGLASFFGAPGHGTKFVYILDKSGSMSGAPFATAKQELIRSLRALQPHEHFFVSFYASRADPMPGGRLVPATPANIERAVTWIRSVSLGGSTKPTESLTHALDRLKPDTIWLLSDGAFSAQVVDTIAAHNRAQKTHINTLAFVNRDGEALLKIIADQNRGDYRFVPGP